MDNVVPPRLAMVDIVTEPCYVLGFPNYVALVLTTFPVGATLRKVPAVGWQGTCSMLGLSLKRLGELEPLFDLEPMDVASPDTGVPTNVMVMGEHRRILLDLSEILPEGIEPGGYEAMVRFGPLGLRTQAGPVHLTFRAPDPHEQGILDRVGPEAEAKGSWGQWTSFAPALDAVWLRPYGTNDPLRFNWVLREILHGPKRLEDISLEVLDVLAGFFAPEREVLIAEILAAHSDSTAFRGQLEKLRREHPELSYWYERIEACQTDIAWAHRRPGAV